MNRPQYHVNIYELQYYQRRCIYVPDFLKVLQLTNKPMTVASYKIISIIIINEFIQTERSHSRIDDPESTTIQAICSLMACKISAWMEIVSGEFDLRSISVLAYSTEFSKHCYDFHPCIYWAHKSSFHKLYNNSHNWTLLQELGMTCFCLRYLSSNFARRRIMLGHERLITLSV